MQTNEQNRYAHPTSHKESQKTTTAQYSHANTRYHTNNRTQTAHGKQKTPTTQADSAPSAYSPDPLATRQILVLHILLVALPFVCVFGDVRHAFGGFAVRASDRTGDVADGGLEGFVEDLADWVADDAEEALESG